MTKDSVRTLRPEAKSLLSSLYKREVKGDFQDIKSEVKPVLEAIAV